MKVEFLAKFSKDIDKIGAPNIKTTVARTIAEVESAHSLQEIRNVKSLRAQKLLIAFVLAITALASFMNMVWCSLPVWYTERISIKCFLK